MKAIFHASLCMRDLKVGGVYIAYHLQSFSIFAF
jgi:hypothetical protein